MNIEELKKKTKDEHEEIIHVSEINQCGYFDAKEAISISKEKGISISDALIQIKKAWRSAEFVPKPEND